MNSYTVQCRFVIILNYLEMAEREILQSEKPIIDFSVLGNAGEEVATLMEAKKYEKVVSMCRQMAASKQKYMILCYAYLGLKEWKNLIEASDRGLEYDINEPEFYSLKAKAMGKLGKNHDRVLLLQTAIKLNNANPSYYRNLGSAYYNLQNFELACEKYDKAIKIEPDNLLNYHNKGSALLKLEKYSQAKKCYQNALQINSNVALSYSGLADCEKKLGNYEQSERLYKLAYEISGKQVYKQDIATLEKQKNLHKYEGSWLYTFAWIRSKIM